MAGPPRELHRVGGDVFPRGLAVCDVGVNAEMFAAAVDFEGCVFGGEG